MFDPKVVRTMALISQVGISMMVPIFMMLFLGIWIESRFGISITLILIILGMAAGFRNCYILLTNASKDPKKKERHNEKADQ